MYNIILYVGIFFMVSGFSLFLYSEMKERQLDREAFMIQQLTKSFNKAKEEEAKWHQKKIWQRIENLEELIEIKVLEKKERR